MRRIFLEHARLMRLLLALLPVLLMAACGQEAPPRVSRAAPSPSPYATRTPTSVTMPTVAAPAPDVALNRSLGDPNAPITVIEYSDYQ